jgi:hypothetical protein
VVEPDTLEDDGAHDDGPDIEGLPTEFVVDDAARAERLERQVAGLQRQLEHRIRQVAHYEAERASGAAAPMPADDHVAELGRKAAAYDDLLAHRSLRALRAARRLTRRSVAALRARRTH